MKLSCLLEEMEYECVQGTLDREITTLVYDSRKVEKDSAFVCISGAVCDGHDFAQEVAKKGAAVLFIEKDVEVPDDCYGDPGSEDKTQHLHRHRQLILDIRQKN